MANMADAARLIALVGIVLGTIGPTVSRAGSVDAVAPWADRAEAAVRQFVETNAQQLANSIRHIAHPEGRRAELVDMEVLASADRAMVTIRVGWSGTSTRRSHLIRVTWEFTPARHLSAKITGDSLPAGIAAQRNAQLDAHFRDKVYPGIARAAGTAHP